MARLRVLKLWVKPLRQWRGCDFTHYGPFEGTETKITSKTSLAKINFTHYGPFEGTETVSLSKIMDFFQISLTMARLRVLKLWLVGKKDSGKSNFTHYGPFEGTETLTRHHEVQSTLNFTHYGPFEGTETGDSSRMSR